MLKSPLKSPRNYQEVEKQTSCCCFKHLPGTESSKVAENADAGRGEPPLRAIPIGPTWKADYFIALLSFIVCFDPVRTAVLVCLCQFFVLPNTAWNFLQKFQHLPERCG